MANVPRDSNHELHDIDIQADFDACFANLEDPSTRNFAVQFDAEHVSCAVNLGKEDIALILDSSTTTSRPCRWINLWGWDQSHRSTVEFLADRYDVSPRLTHLLCPQQPEQRKSGHTHSIEMHHDTRPAPLPISQIANADDLEKAISSKSDITNDDSAPGHCDRKHLFTVSDIIDELWHFCSVDWGRRYLYVGFNALFTAPGDEQQVDSDKPAGQRIWSSVLLCDDGTVVSVFEQPDPRAANYAAVTKIARRNQLNIFQQLSKLPTQSTAQNALMHVTIRAIHNDHTRSNGSSSYSTESASLLLYYLFDDWLTTYALIARREHPYRDKLESLRENMMEKAQVDLIRALHRVGRQLTVLKLIYQSYDIMVNHILQRQRTIRRALRESSTRSQQATDAEWQDSSQFNFIPSTGLSHDGDQGSTVYLATSAIVRFERLQDRIRLYALNQIEQCLEEKEQLVFMVRESAIYS